MRKPGRALTTIASGMAAALVGLQARASEPAPGAAIPIGEASFRPIVPDRPELAQIAVLRGDPATGPSDMLMRMRKGDGVLHVHTADYRLVVIAGSMRHWLSESERAGAAVLGPGSYWFQPGGQPHGDDCLSDECLMFISWSGKRDAAAVR